MKLIVALTVIISVVTCAPADSKDIEILRYDSDNIGVDGYKFAWVIHFCISNISVKCLTTKKQIWTKWWSCSIGRSCVEKCRYWTGGYRSSWNNYMDCTRRWSLYIEFRCWRKWIPSGRFSSSTFVNEDHLRWFHRQLELNFFEKKYY